jgi:hypothetical protein
VACLLEMAEHAVSLHKMQMHASIQKFRSLSFHVVLAIPINPVRYKRILFRVPFERFDVSTRS